MGKKNEYPVFSGLDSLPKGRASEVLTEGCAVLEGGAFRGVYGEGVLDAMMEADINFSCTVGVSAGALNGMNYVTGQIGRSARLNLRFRHDPRYVGSQVRKANDGIIGFDFMFGDAGKDEPYDMEYFLRSERKFYAVCASVETGEALYLGKENCTDMYQAVRASASMPYVSKPVMVDGIPCLDGGCSVKIPYQYALEQGYRKIVLVLTRPKSYRRKENTLLDKISKPFYRRHKEFARVLRESSARSNRELDEIDALEAERRIFVIRPSRDMGIGRLEKDMEKLGAWYYLGYGDAKNCMSALKDYLAAE